jgi:hypothetical protein
MKKHDLPLPAVKILITLLLIASMAQAQQKQITGQLKTVSGEVIPDANVLLTNNHGLILTFCTSDVSGKYVLTLPDSAHIPFLFIEVNHLGYKKIQYPLTAGKSVYDFVLEKKVTALPPVEVKARPIIDRHGDTLSYHVASFAQPEDRSIGDVLRHMPGISISESGELFYNGQAIANLYIHGDDLMDGSYRLAPKIISKEMIKNVEVIQHHQPIKVLQNKKPTDAIAINLVLKDENSLKLSGQAILGAGLPGQFDAALNTMAFNKKFKMLNVLKANNSGIDYSDDFVRSGASSFSGDIGNSRPNALLSAGTPAPNLPRKNYYFNRSGALNTNNLVNTKNEWQLRSNIQAFFDRNTLTYTSRQDTYLQGDTIRYNEEQNGVNKPFLVNTSLTATANKAHYYFTNNLRLNISGNNNSNNLDFNGDSFRQRLHERSYDLSNLIHWIPELKNKSFMEMRWYVNYYNNPQQLHIDAGLNSDILNEGLPYAASNQLAKTPGFFSNAMVAYNAGNGVFRKAFEAGVINERQTLRSTLRLTQTDNTETAYKGDAGNDLHWQRDRFYFNPSLSLKKKSWDASISVPISWQSIHYYQDVYALNNRSNHFFINPAAQFRFAINDEDDLTIRYSYKNNMGNIAGVYRGAILTNYRSLSANDADLQEQNTSGTGINYKFQRSIIMLFAGAGINYNRITANSILSSVFTNNVQLTVLLPYENDQSTWSANANISKYLFVLKTTASFKTTFTRNYSNRFINNEQLPFASDAFSCTAGIDSRFGVITVNYNATGLWTASRQRNKAGVTANTIKQFDQHITVGYSPFKNCFLNAKSRHLYSTQANAADISYLFMDVNMRYKLSKWRMDLELDITNLANIKNHETLFLNANQFAVSSYQLRGRMAMVRVTFNL